MTGNRDSFLQCYINHQMQPYLLNAFLEVQLKPVHNMDTDTTMIQSEGRMDSASRHFLKEGTKSSSFHTHSSL